MLEQTPRVGRLAFVTIGIGVVVVWTVAQGTVDVDLTLRTLREWVAARGLVGMLGFGAAYVVLVLLLVPGAALTLTAGALFGPATGIILVALATSVADALAFLLARYVARDAVLRLQRRHPRFRAFEDALADGSWRIVALLRLNPAIPYSVSNYVFGVSGVPFIPYLIASGVFTLPGAVAYTYLGYVGAETIGGEARSALEWGGLVMGLLASFGTVAYVTVLARRQLAALEPKSSARR